MRPLNPLSAWFLTLIGAGAISLGLTTGASAQDQGAKFATITGTFVVKGVVPKLPPKVKAGQNVKDSAICAASPVPDQAIVVDPETKGLKNVFIWVDDFDANDIPKEFAKPKDLTVKVDQQNCVFKPHAILARTGQTLVLVNSDPVAHNTHISAIRGESVNKLIAANDQKGVQIKISEGDILPVPVTCDIHRFMRANYLVLEHPYADISNAKGQFQITGLPPGEYEFKIWHEAKGYLRDVDIKEVEVQAGETVDLGTLVIDAGELEP